MNLIDKIKSTKNPSKHQLVLLNRIFSNKIFPLNEPLYVTIYGEENDFKNFDTVSGSIKIEKIEISDVETRFGFIKNTPVVVGKLQNTKDGKPSLNVYKITLNYFLTLVNIVL